MTTATLIPSAPELTADDYVVLGLATCFIKEDGEVHQVQIVEPIPSSALETLLKHTPTSYDRAIATTLGTILQGNTAQVPSEFPATAQLCDDFVERLASATRTYKARVTAQSHIPVGTCHTGFNFSTERKRVLNSQRIVRTEDNVKQHEYTHTVL